MRDLSYRLKWKRSRKTRIMSWRKSCLSHKTRQPAKWRKTTNTFLQSIIHDNKIIRGDYSDSNIRPMYQLLWPLFI